MLSDSDEVRNSCYVRTFDVDVFGLDFYPGYAKMEVVARNHSWVLPILRKGFNNWGITCDIYLRSKSRPTIIISQPEGW